LIELRKFILKQMNDLNTNMLTGDNKRASRKQKFGTAGKLKFAAQLYEKLEQNLRDVERKIVILGGEAEMKKVYKPKTRLDVVPKHKFGTVRVRNQKAKKLPPPPKPNSKQVETQVTNEWQECWTEEGYQYFYNITSGESAWELPNNTTAIPSAESLSQSTSTTITTSKSGEWEEFQTEDGFVYYYNSVTGESSWDNPYFELYCTEDNRYEIREKRH